MKTKNLLAIPSILTAIAGLFIISSAIYFTACSTAPQPVGIVYPPKQGYTVAQQTATVLPDPTLPTSTIVIIQTAPGEWEWQITSGNNVLLETSHRTFGSPSAALAHYKATREAMAEQPAPVIIRDFTLAPEAP